MANPALMSAMSLGFPLIACVPAGSLFNIQHQLFPARGSSASLITTTYRYSKANRVLLLFQ